MLPSKPAKSRAVVKKFAVNSATGAARERVMSAVNTNISNLLLYIVSRTSHSPLLDTRRPCLNNFYKTREAYRVVHQFAETRHG